MTHLTIKLRHRNRKEGKMLFYRVLKKYDNQSINYTPVGRYTRRNCWVLVADELYTPLEVARRKIPMQYLEEVNISRKKTYFSFGCRFEFKED